MLDHVELEIPSSKKTDTRWMQLAVIEFTIDHVGVQPKPGFSGNARILFEEVAGHPDLLWGGVNQGESDLFACDHASRRVGVLCGGLSEDMGPVVGSFGSIGSVQ